MNSLAHNIKIVIKGDVQVYGTFPGDTVPPFLQDDELLGEITQQKPEITFNTNRTYKSGKKAPDGIEIRFGTARPTEAIRQTLKDHGFQFSERQTLWYAIDDAKSRELAEKWANEAVEVDTTQYVKQHFWAKVRNSREFDMLRNHTEFWLKTEPPKNFYSKSFLERAVVVDEVIADGLLYFKKFYNTPVNENESGEPGDNEQDDSAAIVDKLQALANGMQEEIDSKINSATSRQRRTPKRVRVAAGMREEGYRLQDIQKVLYALAEAHRNGTINDYPYLSNIRTKKQVELLNFYSNAIKENWSREHIQSRLELNRDNLIKLGINSVEDWSMAEQEKQRLLQQSPASQQWGNTEQERRIKELEDKIWRMNIPGFYPTPQPLIERMLDLADLEPNHSVLDPSAGKGDILDAIRDRFPASSFHLHAIELYVALIEILRLKGYTPIHGDFLAMASSSFVMKVDRIIMNPPFENGQDIDHVTHALQLLKPGGRLVAIMGEGAFFRQFKKDVAFRKLLKEKNAYISEPIKDAFKNAFNTTGVNVRIVAINADGSPITTSQPSAQPRTAEDNTNHEPDDDNSNAPDDLELLQLEAEAELELLKMRVELERKRKRRSMDGIAGINQDKLRRFRQKAWALQDSIEILDFN